jgi:DNA-binding transcriptional ArsR family regulator
VEAAALVVMVFYGGLHAIYLLLGARSALCLAIPSHNTPLNRERIALAAFDSRQLYRYILILTGSVPDSPVAEHRAGRLMPATALQTFKAQFFRALSHPVRIKILEILIGGDRSVQELQEALKLDQPVVSQQLAVLRNQGIVTSEKKGLSVRYALRDPAIEELLAVARRIFNNHLVNTRGMLRELQREGRRV